MTADSAEACGHILAGPALSHAPRRFPGQLLCCPEIPETGVHRVTSFLCTFSYFREGAASGCQENPGYPGAALCWACCEAVRLERLVLLDSAQRAVGALVLAEAVLPRKQRRWSAALPIHSQALFVLWPA